MTTEAFFLSFLVGSFALAGELSFSKNSRSFDSQFGSLTVKGLAFSCLALEETPDHLPCAASNTSPAKKSNIKINAGLSNGYSNLTRIRDILEGKNVESVADKLLSEEPVLQLDAGVSLYIISKYLNSAYVPGSYNFFSVVRNDANPEAEVSAVESKYLVVQTGYAWGPLSAGLELRQADRKYVKNRFLVLDLATDSGKELLKSKTSSELYAEPSLGFTLHHRLKFRLVSV